METVNVRLPEAEIKEIDRMVKRHHYGSRSEFFRQALRAQIEDHLLLADDLVADIERARTEPSISHESALRQLGLK